MMRYPRGYNRVSTASRLKPIILIVLVLLAAFLSRKDAKGGN